MDTLKDCKNYAGSLSLISTRENMEILLKGAEDNEKSYLVYLSIENCTIFHSKTGPLIEI